MAADSNRKETVSAVIMSRNCENLIEGTLRSVVNWADEIVVIDGYSTDGTLEVCKKYGAKIFQNKWDGYRFATERNLGIEKSTCDWCLHIDPDERASDELKSNIDQVLSEGTTHNGFEFRKKNFFLGHAMMHGGWYHYSLHFFRRGKAIYEGIIHETLKVDGSVGKIEGPMHHYPYPSILPFVSRHNGYSSREASMLLEENNAFSPKEVLYNLKVKPIKRFIKFYFKKKGFLDGIYGLIFSILYAWVHFLNWSKYWEMTNECHEVKYAK